MLHEVPDRPVAVRDDVTKSHTVLARAGFCAISHRLESA
jgi:hypothetical protein